MIGPNEPWYWFWWILAVLLLIVETFAGEMYFIWLATGAAIMGFVAIGFPMLPWEVQFFLYSLLSAVTVVLWRIWLQGHPPQSDDPLLNRRADQYIGRVCTLTHPIFNGEGRIKLGDSLWNIQGEDCPVGTKVRIVGVNGIVLVVKPISLPSESSGVP